ncbi:class I SAM-dependent methyltransferase [Caenimonas sp. DR4.4]|uniref:Class I SAM-dependent methyltransferase n=1 Tax=Caenimonas aquaedulcis TaxID=2793270 RepID=A0A931ME29_9BURK|nr:class I SAM-dependent methyltransferase [Caenimonas aquaedulcis]
MDAWIGQLLAAEGLAAMGHAQRPDQADLGLGWLYYGLARLIKPELAVVIGSWRGFAPMVIARALADNGQGRVLFIDPSLVDDFWRDPAAVRAYFARFGLHNIDHHRLTTQEFVASPRYSALGEVGLLFIDGYHSEEQARFDYESFRPSVPAHGVALFHDSIRVRPSRIYGDDKVYEHRVRHLIDELRGRQGLQVVDLPYGDGLTMVRTAGMPEVLRA